MMYHLIIGFARTILALINGNVRYKNKDRLPKGENYILVAPHRTWWEPFYLAIGALPMKFSFMAKKELFKNPILRFILTRGHAFPVDRDNPGPSAIKTPVKILKGGQLSLGMFPSGSRHSTELKGGAALIAKMAGVKIVPAVYQGSLTFKGLFKRQRVTINYGEPIDVSEFKKMDKVAIAKVEKRLYEAFDLLDQEIDPNFKYEVESQD